MISLTEALPCYSLLNKSNFFGRSGYVDVEFNRVAHVRTAIVISDWFGCKNTVGIQDFLIVSSQEESCQNVHLLHYQLKKQTPQHKNKRKWTDLHRQRNGAWTRAYLDSIYLTPVSDVKWMDNEQEDNWLEQCLGGVSKYKGHDKKLRSQKHKKFALGNSQYD